MYLFKKYYNCTLTKKRNGLTALAAKNGKWKYARLIVYNSRGRIQGRSSPGETIESDAKLLRCLKWCKVKMDLDVAHTHISHFLVATCRSTVCPVPGTLGHQIPQRSVKTHTCISMFTSDKWMLHNEPHTRRSVDTDQSRSRWSRHQAEVQSATLSNRYFQVHDLWSKSGCLETHLVSRLFFCFFLNNLPYEWFKQSRYSWTPTAPTSGTWYWQIENTLEETGSDLLPLLWHSTPMAHDHKALMSSAVGPYNR